MKSYLIFGDIEEKELEIIIKIPVSNKDVQRLAVAFVDDTSFYIASMNFEMKIQQILDSYTTLYEATRRLVKHNKSHYYL